MEHDIGPRQPNRQASGVSTFRRSSSESLESEDEDDEDDDSRRLFFFACQINGVWNRNPKSESPCAGICDIAVAEMSRPWHVSNYGRSIAFVKETAGRFKAKKSRTISRAHLRRGMLTQSASA
jgi:hypothetical protein